jgi:hypothetical protein
MRFEQLSNTGRRNSDKGRFENLRAGKPARRKGYADY